MDMKSLKIKINHIKAKHNMVKAFKKWSFTTDNFIIMYNTITHLGFKLKDIGYMPEISKLNHNYYFKFESSKEVENKVIIEIMFNDSSQHINMTIRTTKSNGHGLNTNTKYNHLTFKNRLISLHTLSNAEVSMETSDFLSTILDILSDMCIYTANNINW